MILVVKSKLATYDKISGLTELEILLSSNVIRCDNRQLLRMCWHVYTCKNSSSCSFTQLVGMYCIFKIFCMNVPSLYLVPMMTKLLDDSLWSNGVQTLQVMFMYFLEIIGLVT